MTKSERWDVLILGAGAAGLFCAGVAASGGKRVLVVDHAKAPGEKIRISGGGRCNFTNLFTEPGAFLSANPHFCKSALSRYTQYDFLELVERYRIAWHEKTLGQLFCDHSAKDIIAMLLDEAGGAEVRLSTHVEGVVHGPDGFRVSLSTGAVDAPVLVVATGGKSIPKMGATGLGYDLARQFGHRTTETRAGLVPFTVTDRLSEMCRSLSGVSVPAEVRCNDGAFSESMLFTHRGLSGPSMLQISSYWREGDALAVRLCPDTDAFDWLRDRRVSDGRKAPATVLSDLIPRKLAEHLVALTGLTGTMGDQSDARLAALAKPLTDWTLTPAGTEGYRTAEVTLGGVDTDGLSSRTMESRTQPGLFFIGEVVDVTGWLGGYNFQWAWSSAWAAGTAIAAR